MATPNFVPAALSRQLGPLADAANMIAGKFNPLSYFGDGAKLLGGISLGQIIKQAVGDELLSVAPSIDVQEMVDPTTNLPQSLTISYTLTPDLQSDEDGGGTGLFNPHPDASLVISASLTVPVADPSQATYSVSGALSEFDIDLFGPDEDDQFLVLNIEKVGFVAQTGAQPTFSVSVRSVDFGQALSFVDILEQFLSSVGGDGGPAIDVEPSGITVNYSLPIPNASLGVISISTCPYIPSWTCLLVARRHGYVRVLYPGEPFPALHRRHSAAGVILPWSWPSTAPVAAGRTRGRLGGLARPRGSQRQRLPRSGYLLLLGRRRYREAVDQADRVPAGQRQAHVPGDSGHIG